MPLRAHAIAAAVTSRAFTYSSRPRASSHAASRRGTQPPFEARSLPIGVLMPSRRLHLQLALKLHLLLPPCVFLLPSPRLAICLRLQSLRTLLLPRARAVAAVSDLVAAATAAFAIAVATAAHAAAATASANAATAAARAASVLPAALKMASSFSASAHVKYTIWK